MKTRMWYAVYYVNGKQVRVCAETEDRDEAILFLRRKMAEAGTLENLGAMPERVTMNQLFDLLLAWYAKMERRSLYDVQRKIEKKNGLRAYWGKIKAQAVTSSEIDRYHSLPAPAKTAPCQCND